MTVCLNVLQRILTKKSNLLFMLVLPTVISASIIFISLMENKYTIGIIDYDQTGFTEEFETYLSKTCKIQDMTEKEMKDKILNDGVQCVFVIPKGYTDSLLGEEPYKIKTYYQEGSNYASPILQKAGSYLSASVLIGASSQDKETFDSGMDEFQKENLQMKYLYANSSYNSKTSAAVTAFGYIAFCMLFLMTFSTSLIMEDKTTGVTDRLWTAPIKKGSYYIQHLLSYFLISVVQTVVVILVLPLVGQVSFGQTALEIFRVIVICLLFSLVCISMGIAINTHAKSKLDAGAISSLINLPVLMLGGCLWPIEEMPDILQKIGSALPTAWFIKGASIVVYGGTFSDALQFMIYMSIFSAVVIAATFLVKCQKNHI